MPFCAVKSCRNKSNTSSIKKDGITFHLFTKNPALRLRWIECCGRKSEWVPKRTSTICSRHFDTSQFECLQNQRRKLKNDAVPTLFLTDFENQSKSKINVSKGSASDTAPDNIMMMECEVYVCIFTVCSFMLYTILIHLLHL
ncbi:THAP domain-containing protein 1 A-like [Colias croceus]|uniref:THAP domain-containing protein 1 A-like n=1 Tax=Colias crocea TaxID=72248 RepID=UPI001E281902|nr:THAP domain-containing protein 1 A-like [Colias croceus]